MEQYNEIKNKQENIPRVIHVFTWDKTEKWPLIHLYAFVDFIHTRFSKCFPFHFWFSLSLVSLHGLYVYAYIFICICMHLYKCVCCCFMNPMHIALSACTYQLSMCAHSDSHQRTPGLAILKTIFERAWLSFGIVLHFGF